MRKLFQGLFYNCPCRSKSMLLVERDNLEAMVANRTKELQAAQLEQLAQLYRFAEFGRLSAGLFHDLMSPLTALSLNIESAQSHRSNAGDLSKAQHHLDEAFLAAKRMERFIVAVRKQIGKRGEVIHFSLIEETREVIEILSYKAHVSSVEINLTADEDIVVVGDPICWSQAILNLISNSIDAYDEIADREKHREIKVSFSSDECAIICTVADTGIGISSENIEKIFDPFFTTKTYHTTKGTGIGLSLVKKIIECGFKGKVEVQSTLNQGTTFTITIPRE